MDFCFLLLDGYFNCFNKKYFDRELNRTLKRLCEEGYQKDEAIDSFQVALEAIKEDFNSQFEYNRNSIHRFFENEQYSEDRLKLMINNQTGFIEACEGYVPPYNFDELDINRYSINTDSLWRKGIIKLTIQNRIYLKDIELIQENLNKIKLTISSTPSGALNTKSDVFLIQNSLYNYSNKGFGDIRSEIYEIIKKEEKSRDKTFFLNESYEELFIANLAHLIIYNKLLKADQVIYLTSKSKTLFGQLLGRLHNKYRQSAEYFNITRSKDIIFLNLMRTVYDWKDITDDHVLAKKLKDTTLRPPAK